MQKEWAKKLPVDHPDAIFKGGHVFQENWVTDGFSEAAMFGMLSSQLAAMEAGRMVDAYGLFDNNSITQADAKQAYVQAKLKGPAQTWVRLPKECRG